MFTKLVLSVLSLLLLLLVLPTGEASAGTYVVQYGDTLWDLGIRFYRDYDAWKLIWEANPAIGNPHWIYPGDVLLIPAYGGQVRIRMAYRQRIAVLVIITGTAINVALLLI